MAYDSDIDAALDPLLPETRPTLEAFCMQSHLIILHPGRRGLTPEVKAEATELFLRLAVHHAASGQSILLIGDPSEAMWLSEEVCRLSKHGFSKVSTAMCCFGAARYKEWAFFSNLPVLQRTQGVCRHIHATNQWLGHKDMRTGKRFSPHDEEASFTAEASFLLALIATESVAEAEKHRH